YGQHLHDEAVVDRVDGVRADGEEQRDHGEHDQRPPPRGAAVLVGRRLPPRGGPHIHEGTRVMLIPPVTGPRCLRVPDSWKHRNRRAKGTRSLDALSTATTGS